MRNYMIRRVSHSVFIILGLMALLFFAINVLGDPVELLLDEEASQEVIEAMRKKYGLDRPIYVRFGDFYKNMLTGNFGKSIRHKIGAGGLVLDRLPNTAALAVVAWTLGSIGIPLGMLAARRPRGVVDRLVNLLSFAIISVPEFWLALMIILVMSVQWGLLPTSGFDGLGPGGWKFIILPALSLCPRVMGRNAQITRATMIEEMGKQYVATARAKGLPNWKAVAKYPVRVAINPLISTVGYLLPSLVSGSVIVSVVLSLPTIGPVLLTAIWDEDIYLAGFVILLLGVLTVVGTLISDILLAVVDPRIKLTK